MEVFSTFSRVRVKYNIETVDMVNGAMVSTIP